MKPQYRLAVERDAEQLLELTLRAYEPIRKLGIRFAAAHADLDLVLKNIRQNACYVMEEDGRIIATITLRMPWGKQPGPYGVPHIWWFAVDPDTGKKGIGTKLLQWLEETILRDTLKVPFVSLGTADKHPWLIEMYERKGYVRSGEQDLGKGHITVYMKKQLRHDL
ncbi:MULTISPECIES: sulfur-containing aminoacid acetyltransferase SnaB [Bacillus]|jgi:GNAT superfamily N-acetyltransferase|uniref:sulfur-containing aminoacid acetyltransferase SnaB n=1 Tax=Bacillus TaxID=1386 RepID=UPI0006A84FFE|nr:MULTISPECIES: sulfur-containing aminoacid acetyltransferase SnaB [Bacillus]MCB7162217.1 sulfur-containing aminoacid acetyltransferase SnaB [Bacillus subtilis]MCB7460095.1 sulfur-containing aminoacid acetyltransferase SnaB [Bacillus subtilis]MDI6588431.1 sulfur-containing aminoacid acetyltransferase SnaB [Bacillus subtilis]MDM5456047.1 sulfur-containing aminoacid acetyltransferase SnaB [Bacillus subtilis]MDR4912827.1 sulfur-containing aminoacid acetyltransferase SnaB [Bacillus subtilis]